jgi:hypothetical protein
LAFVNARCTPFCMQHVSPMSVLSSLYHRRSLLASPLFARFYVVPSLACWLLCLPCCVLEPLNCLTLCAHLSVCSLFFAPTSLFRVLTFLCAPSLHAAFWCALILYAAILYEVMCVGIFLPLPSCFLSVSYGKAHFTMSICAINCRGLILLGCLRVSSHSRPSGC